MTVLIRHEGVACGCDATDVSPGLMSVDAARTAALRLVVPVAAREQVPLAQALGRVLAQPLRSKTPMPPFDASAVDGYAVRLDDLIGPGPWTLALQDRVAAGDGRAIRLGSGALRIFTGAPLPLGADAVVMQEDVAADAAHLHIRHRPQRGANLRHAGEEIPEGQIVVAAGHRLGPREIGAAAANGHATPYVWRRPRIALLTTGNEVSQTGTTLAPGCIWDANTSLLVAAFQAAGADLVAVEHAPDDLAALAVLMARLAKAADMLVTTGGVSVGEEDHCKAAFRAAQGEIVVAGVAMKPGKPVTIGRLNGTVWIGLPGNPLSAYVTWQVLGGPMVKALSGATASPAPTQLVVAGQDLLHKPGRCEYRPATIIGFDDLGRQVIFAAPAVHSGRLTSLVGVDGLIVIPAGIEAVQQGDLLDFLPFCTSQMA
jgi:molybdopterin molybdotransferase